MHIHPSIGGVPKYHCWKIRINVFNVYLSLESYIQDRQWVVVCTMQLHLMSLGWSFVTCHCYPAGTHWDPPYQQGLLLAMGNPVSSALNIWRGSSKGLRCPVSSKYSNNSQYHKLSAFWEIPACWWLNRSRKCFKNSQYHCSPGHPSTNFVSHLSHFTIPWIRLNKSFFDYP